MIHTPAFLTLDEIVELHADLITEFGGTPEVRDWDLLHSAIATPQAGFGDQYLHVDLYEMAAAYLFHLVQNHPFVDGNKRIGLAAALTFLELNGMEISATNPVLVVTVLDVAQGKMGKAALAEFFRAHTRKTRKH
jgi:death on curing protein